MGKIERDIPGEISECELTALINDLDIELQGDNEIVDVLEFLTRRLWIMNDSGRNGLEKEVDFELINKFVEHICGYIHQNGKIWICSVGRLR